jgi:hypothetical protein
MTSQLNVDTIVDKAGSGGTNVKIGNTSTYVGEGGSGTQNTVQGLAKSWSSIDGDASGTPVFDSFNTSSITDNDTGIYISNFTNNMNNDDYVVTTGNAGNGGNGCVFNTNYDTHTTSATGVKVLRTDNQARVDTTVANITINGDLA